MKLRYTMIVLALVAGTATAKEGMKSEEALPDAEKTAVTNAVEAEREMEMRGAEERMEEGATATEAMAAEEKAAEQSGFSRGSVVRSIFTTSVEEREPVDNVKQLGNTQDKIIYYTELRDMAGQKAKHRWEYKGEVMAEVEFDVKGQRWRVWSSKSFVPQWTGEWKVSVLNGAGEVIAEDVFDYTEAAMQQKTMPGAESTDMAQ